MSLRLHPIARRGLGLLRRSARSSGIRFKVTSGRRSLAEQRRLRELFEAGDPRQRLPVALPGFSQHNYGLAIDVVGEGGRHADLIGLARQIGWTWGGPADAVHLQVISQPEWRALLARALR